MTVLHNSFTVRVGQYEGYVEHVAASRKGLHGDGGKSSRVPTAAAVTLASENPRWARASPHTSHPPAASPVTYILAFLSCAACVCVDVAGGKG